MRIVGAMVVGAGEGEKWLDQCLEQLHGLCDKVVICQNKTDFKTKRIIFKHKFLTYEDNREWGKEQWRIKQNLLEQRIAPLKPDWIVALDADEFFDKRFTRAKAEELASKPYDVAYYFWCVELWDKENQYNPDYLFEDIRFYKFLPQTGLNFKNQPVHGGIAPEYAYNWGTHTDLIFKHYGLLKLTDRQAKVERYRKYDPEGKYLPKTWYEGLLSSNSLKPFVEEEFVKNIAPVKFRQKPMPFAKQSEQSKKVWKFLNPHGVLITLDKEKHFEETRKRRGFQFLGEETLGVFDREEIPVVEKTEEKPKPMSWSCDQCSLVAYSEVGLKIHKSRMHK